jgi:hypothetical protein
MEEKTQSIETTVASLEKRISAIEAALSGDYIPTKVIDAISRNVNGLGDYINMISRQR